MFKISDGRDRFYQWDSDRQLIVEDASINEVHFCNRTDDCSLVCETYVNDGVTLVNVPNILLQSDWRIRVYAFDKKYTKHEACYEVTPRTKPADYVYTETETLNYNNLLDRINEVDANIGAAVTEYLEENPVEVDLSNYYNKPESDERFALKNEIPDGIATEDYVDDAVANVKVDLTGYATEKYVDAAIDAVELIPGPTGKDGKDGVDGAPGKDGKDTVYVGASEPSADYNIWINPVGVPTEGLITYEMMEDYVNERLAAIIDGNEVSY